MRSAGLSGGEEVLRESSRTAESAFRHLCRLLSSTLLQGSPSTPPELFSYPESSPSPEDTLSTFAVLRESGLVAYLAASPLLASVASKRDWDEVWRVWGALRGEWIRSGIGLLPRPGSTSGFGVSEEATESRLVEGWLLGAKTEHLVLLELFPRSRPPSAALLSALLAPSLVALKAHVLSYLQTLKKDPLPWRAYGLFAGLTRLGPEWDEFFAATGAKGGEWLVLDGPGQGEVGKAIRSACTRAIPEAVESAKVSNVIRSGEPLSVAVSSTTTEVRPYFSNSSFQVSAC